MAGFFTLLWRHIDKAEARTQQRIDQMEQRTGKRLDKIDDRLDLIQKDQREFYGVTQKLEGRVDEISHRTH
jgi:DNA anti-recombination protein RmuC